MKIALISPPWIPVPPPAYGGTETVIDSLARGFARAGHEVLLFATGDSTCPVPKSWVFDRSDRVEFGAAGPELRQVVAAYGLATGYDIIHDHTVVGPMYATTMPSPPLVVTTNHQPFDHDRDAIYQSICGKVAVIGISHNQVAASNAHIAAVIHHGIDVDRFPVGAGDGGYFLYIGRMHPKKGARRAALVARDAGVPLLIAAKMRDRSERAYFARHIEPLLGDGVEYVGEATAEDRLRLLQGARALLNPIGWREPFGLVMVEALACGTPVIAFPQGAAVEIVDDGVTGYLCPDRDAMVVAVHRVGELDRAVCRAAAATRFSAELMVENHLALYRRLLAQRRRDPRLGGRLPMTRPVPSSTVAIQPR